MTIEELIAELEELDKTRIVLVGIGSAGFAEINAVTPLIAIKNPQKGEDRPEFILSPNQRSVNSDESFRAVMLD